MARLNLLLLALFTASALALITSQNRVRKLFSELEQEQERSRQLEVEYGQLQLEASTWAMHSRVQAVARRQLHMHVPEASQLKIVQPEDPAR